MVDIFISYRTADAAHGAAACYELLAARFGPDHVFRDCVSMLPGQDYPHEINMALEQSRALVAVIGPGWLAVDANGGRLIDNPRDWVRREIARALARGILVIPLLLDEAPLPSSDDLPAEVSALTRRQVARVRHQLLGPDVGRLADQITELVPGLGRSEPVPPPPDRLPGRRLSSFLRKAWPRRNRPVEAPATHIVPTWNGSVVHRPELHGEIVSALIEHHTTTPVALVTAIRGGGGFGKTVLAAEVCRDTELVARFPGGILWVTLGERPREAALTEMINDLRRRLRVPGEESPPLDNLHQAGQELGRLLDRRSPTLLVVDDVWSAADLRPFLYGGASCTRLVTTRMAGALPNDARQVRVDELTVEEAHAVLTRGLTGLSWHVTSELIRLTGRWALLIALVNRAIVEAVQEGAEPDVAATQVAGTLRRDGPAALDLGDEQQREHLVGATIEVSLSFLSEPDRERFLGLGIFHEDVWIPEDLLETLWGAGRAGPLCRQLARMSLVTSRRADDTAAIRLHDVIRAYVRGGRDLSTDHASFLDRIAALVGSADGEGNRSWWELPLDAEYLWRWLPYHLKGAGRKEEHATLVADPRWVVLKTRVSGPLAVEADIAEIDTPIAAALRHAIAQSAHLLGPTNPSHAVVPVLLSRLGAEPLLVRLFKDVNVQTPRLSNHWALPDVPDRALLRVITGHEEPVNACSWSPDGTRLVTGARDRTVRVWSVVDGAQDRELPGHPGTVNACSWSPDGRLIATACDDGALRVWNAADGTLLRELSNGGSAETGCTWSCDSAFVASCGRDGVVRVWDVETGVLRNEFGDRSGPMNDCAWSIRGEIMATASDDGVVRIWRVDEERLMMELPGHNGWVSACAWSPDGTVLVSCGQDGLVRVWDAASGVRKGELNAGTGWVTGCSWSPDSRLLAVSGDDGVVRVWAVADGLQRGMLTGHRGWAGTCAWSPDGMTLASAGHDTSVRLWDAHREVEHGPSYSHTGTVLGLAWSADGRRLATAGDDHTVRLWDAAGTSLGTLTGHSGPVRGCDWAPDGRLLASAGDDGTIRLWDTARQVQRAELTGHTGWVYSCAWSPDGNRIASAGDHTVRLWNPAREEQEAVLTGHTGRVNHCTWSPDGSVVASASDDRSARVWDPASGTLLAELTGHTGRVHSCDWSTDGALLATTSDYTVRVWDWRTGRCVTLMRTEEHLLDCSWSPALVDPLLALAGAGGIYVFAYHP